MAGSHAQFWNHGDAGDGAFGGQELSTKGKKEKKKKKKKKQGRIAFLPHPAHHPSWVGVIT